MPTLDAEAEERASVILATSNFPGCGWVRPCRTRRAYLVGFTDATGEDHIRASVGF